MTFNSFEYPNELEKIFEKLNSHNLKAIIVGGFVRDFFLSKSSKDIDIEIYGLSNIDELIKLLKEFGKVYEVGKSFGVCKLELKYLDLDFSMPRIDNKTSSGHRGFIVETKRELDFKTASSRRDFTINSIGYDTKIKIILDPYDGLKDLKNLSLKIVDKKSFIEDPLRVFRAMSMVARFELQVEAQTLELCHEMVKNKLLEELAKERIFEEFKKLFLKSQQISFGLEFLKNIGIESFFPELNFEKKIFEKTLCSMNAYQTNKTNDDKTNIKLLLVLLCYSFQTNEVDSFLVKLSNKKNFSREIKILINDAKLLKENQDTYTLKKCATSSKLSELCLLLDAQGVDTSKISKEAQELGILNTSIPMLITGKDLLKAKLLPSREFSKILLQTYEAQLNSKFTTKDEALIWIHKYIL